VAAIPLGCVLPAQLNAIYPHARGDPSTRAYLMLLRVEVTAFHSELNRLVSVALVVRLPCMVVSHHPTLWSPDFPPADAFTPSSGSPAYFAGALSLNHLHAKWLVL
jgi:hypothetical protein